MENNQSDQFVKVSKIYQQQASIGPVPADQLVPWAGLTIANFLICEVILSLGLAVWGVSSVWLIASWWFLTGNKSYQYTDLWIMPNQDWVNLTELWISAENHQQFQQKCQMKTKEKVTLSSPDGKKTTTYRPFQIESHLHVPLNLSLGGQRFSCWLLNWSLD